MKNSRALLFATAALVLLPLHLVLAQEVFIPGKVVTGFNEYVGQPDIEFPSIGTAGFYTLGEYDPGAAEPIPLSPQTSDDALLATRVDDNFFFISPGGDPNDLDPAFVNVPLRQVGTNVSLGDDVREPQPSSSTVSALTNSQAAPAGPVTLGQWKQARGFVRIACHDDGTVDFLLAARGLLPRRLYSVWAVVLDPVEGLRAVAFSGVPNAFVSSARGRGSLHRQLGSCPLMPDEDGSLLAAVQLYFHSDQMLNGVHPSIPQAEGGLALGSIVHAQLEFNVNGIQQLLTPEGWSDTGCEPGFTTYCLNDGRFEVEVNWTDFAGQQGMGRTTDFSSDASGRFYFFSEDNEEMLVKVLDGCGFNNHFWVFAAATTTVEFQLTVRDTATDTVRTYSNALGNAARPVADTGAFATCP